ncbi:MAG: metallophosphoesterase [Paludibacteraceae bacterium]
MRYTFFIFILLVFIGMLSYVLIRGGQALSLSGIWKNVFIISSVVLFLSFFAGMIFGAQMPALLGKNITFWGNSFLVVLIYLVFAFLATDVILLSNKLFHFIKTDVIAFRFWTMMAGLLVILVVMVIGNYKFNHPQTVHLNIISEKPHQQRKVKIVAVSDVHLGVSIDKQRLKQYVELINAQQPDMVLIGGDLIDRSIKPVVTQKMEEELKSIHAPMGIYAVFGNHEHFSESKKLVKEFYQKAGVHLLTDSVVLVNNQFYVAGRDDKINPARKTLKDILNNIDTKKPVLLLDHQPSSLPEAEQNSVDLQFSGHTHNGQFFPGRWFVKQMFELGYGYKKKGNTHYYVSSGLGLWGPEYRIGTQSELVVIDFKY